MKHLQNTSFQIEPCFLKNGLQMSSTINRERLYAIVFQRKENQSYIIMT